jgi:hypothetical protein
MTHVPSDRIIKIENHEIYITTSKFKLNPKRRLLETLCVLDLMRHCKQNKCIFGPSIQTVVTEGAYFDALCMVDHLSCPTSIIFQALEKYPQNVRVTSNALSSYSPTSDFIYISFNLNH